MGSETVNVELEYYDLQSNTWTKQLSILHYTTGVFASGGIRNAFMAYNCNLNDWKSHPMVLKISKYEAFQDENNARNQVIMQAKCMEYAKEYNKYPGITKKVNYVQCILVKFLFGQWTGKYGTIEQYIGENFIKHNTVHPLFDGYALTDRNTPQAFSHFTFEKSNKTEIVVDVQGVGDCYTDPQLYSVSALSPAPPYGPADWGIGGISNFFRHHQCNAICSYLNLDPIRPGDMNTGTQINYTY